MSKDPAARPTAAHFARELRGMASGAVTTGGMAAAPRRTRGWLVLAGAAAVALAAVALTRATVEPEAQLPPVALRSPDVPSLGPFPVPTPPPLVVMHGSVATPEPSPAPRATSAFRVALAGGMLTILNESQGDERDLRITLRDAAGHAHRATAAACSRLARRSCWRSTRSTPPPPAGFRPARVAVRAKGAAHDTLVTP
jgi:hypothetical protein